MCRYAFQRRYFSFDPNLSTGTALLDQVEMHALNPFQELVIGYVVLCPVALLATRNNVSRFIALGTIQTINSAVDVITIHPLRSTAMRRLFSAVMTPASEYGFGLFGRKIPHPASPSSLVPVPGDHCVPRCNSMPDAETWNLYSLSRSTNFVVQTSAASRIAVFKNRPRTGNFLAAGAPAQPYPLAVLVVSREAQNREPAENRGGQVRQIFTLAPVICHGSPTSRGGASYPVPFPFCPS